MLNFIGFNTKTNSKCTLYKYLNMKINRAFQ